MNIRERLKKASELLDKANAEVEAENYHIAIKTIATAYANVREALQHSYELDRESKQTSSPAGDEHK